MTERLAALFTD